MNIDQAWREIRGTEAEKILMAAHAAGGGLTGQQVQQVVSDEWAGINACARLRELGMAHDEASYDGEIDLTSDGRSLGQKVEQSRVDGPERLDAVQRAMLRFIDLEKPDRASAFAGRDVEGRQVSQEVARMVFRYLRDNGLVEVEQRVIGDDLFPTLTINGVYAMHEPNIREYVERGFIASTTYDYSTRNTVNGGTIGAMVSGQGNAANVVQHLTIDERTQTLSLIDKVLADLGDADEDARLRAKVEEIKAEAEGPNPSKPGIVAKARDALLIASATEGGRQVIQWIGQIVAGLGA